MESKTLIIKHLPVELEISEQEELLKHFGAVNVHCMGNNGKLKHTAFAIFSDHESAKHAMSRLHQLNVLGSVLVAEFAKQQWRDYFPTELGSVKVKERSEKDELDEQMRRKREEKAENERKEKVAIAKRINSLAYKWGLEYPLNPQLQYIYPAPTVTILTNIANAMAAVPRFYVQVLHLMNKMCLPAPFGALTATPPIPQGAPSKVLPPMEPDILREEEMDVSSSEESEIESDTEKTKSGVDNEALRSKRPRKKDRVLDTKRLRLQLHAQAQLQEVAGIIQKSSQPSQDMTDVFDQTISASAKKIEFKLSAGSADTASVAATGTTSAPTSAAEKTVTDDSVETITATVVEGGFGKIEPQKKDKSVDETVTEDDWGDGEFISSRELRHGRVSRHEMEKLNVFKNYSAGEPTSRLYIKNLAKQTDQKDLHYIYGRYVHWDNEEEQIMFDVRLMEGRMKGQAFITLPNETVASDAVRDTNGFQLHGRPMVVTFARSAKPKDKDDAKKT